MRRHAALHALSREHHVALEVALWLRRADELTVRAAAERFVAFMADAGEAHFAAEERAVVPLARRDLAAQVLADHRDLRRRAVLLRAAGDAVRVADARAAGEALRAHVRFEERELFPHLEATLTPLALLALGRHLERQPARRFVKAATPRR